MEENRYMINIGILLTTPCVGSLMALETDRRKVE
jgi:hypothetical protein